MAVAPRKHSSTMSPRQKHAAATVAHPGALARNRPLSPTVHLIRSLFGLFIKSCSFLLNTLTWSRKTACHSGMTRCSFDVSRRSVRTDDVRWPANFSASVARFVCIADRDSMFPGRLHAGVGVKIALFVGSG